jgi:hypothetical protein
MFWDIPDLWPVWLLGAISELKITANSTYWKAKRGRRMGGAIACEKSTLTCDVFVRPGKYGDFMGI